MKMNQLQGRYKSVSRDELELPPKIRKSQSRKIKKFLSNHKSSSVDNLTEIQISNDKSLQEGNSINPISNVEVKLFSFGPYFRKDFSSTFLMKIKDQACKHVLERNFPEEQQYNAKEVYMSIIREETKDLTYYADGVEDLPRSEFRLMMLTDALLFLQLALKLVLESPNPLGYLPGTAFFANKPNKKDAKMWIESMFLVGNQIPLLILNKLLDQEFFQSVIMTEKDDPLCQSSLCKKILYDLLFSSSKEGQKGSPQTEDDQQPPIDLLHVLYNQILGPPMKQKSYGMPEDYETDLEANNEIIASDSILDDQINRTPSDADDTADDTGDQKRTFSSATDLSRSSIGIKLNKSGGVRSISFKSRYFWANLYLPPLLIDDYTEIMFRNLIAYEAVHQPLGINNHRGKVSSYIQLMSDVIQTARDVRFLKSRNIIQFQGTINPNIDYELPKMLRRLSNQDTPLEHESNQDTLLEYDFQLLSHKIRNYCTPWSKIKSILNLVVVLTLVQTVVTLISYIHPRSAPSRP